MTVDRGPAQDELESSAKAAEGGTGSNGTVLVFALLAVVLIAGTALLGYLGYQLFVTRTRTTPTKVALALPTTAVPSVVTGTLAATGPVTPTVNAEMATPVPAASVTVAATATRPAATATVPPTVQTTATVQPTATAMATAQPKPTATATAQPKPTAAATVQPTTTRPVSPTATAIATAPPSPAAGAAANGSSGNATPGQKASAVNTAQGKPTGTPVAVGIGTAPTKPGAASAQAGTTSTVAPARAAATAAATLPAVTTTPGSGAADQMPQTGIGLGAPLAVAMLLALAVGAHQLRRARA